MLSQIFQFELRYHLKGPLLVSVFAIFFLLTFGGVTVDNIQIGSTDMVNVNSPYAIATNVLIWSLMGMFLPTAFMVSGILRDATYNTEELFYSKPVNEKTFILGRYLGGYAATALAFTSVPIAILVGSQMPWLDPDNVGPTNLGHYVQIFVSLGLTNLLIAGTIFFTVANISRSTVATYTALVVLFVFYFLGNTLLDDPDLRDIVALADPFAFNTYTEMTRYWTPHELNTQLVPFEGVMLANRLIWLGLSFAAVLGNLAFFSFRKRGSIFARKSKKTPLQLDEQFLPVHITLPRYVTELTDAVTRRQFATRIKFEIHGVVTSVAFWVLLAIGMFNSIGSLLDLGLRFGTPVYPVTRILIDTIDGTFAFIPLIIVIYYASELVWRERNVQVSDIIDATPTPNWVFVVSKCIALILILIGLFSVSFGTAIFVQLGKGHGDIEISQYVIRMLVQFVLPISMVAILSIFAQVITNNRWIGILLMVMFVISRMVLNNVGLEHNLYQFSNTPDAPYSDMNGYGHFLGISLWFLTYWGFVTLGVLVLTYLLWNRGALTSVITRMRLAGREVTSTTGSLLFVAFLGAAVSGGWIFYNTNILNEYQTTKDLEKLGADYEKQYRQYETAQQPTLTDVSIDVDIFPHERRYDARGTYVLVNKTDTAIDTLYFSYGFNAIIRRQTVDGARLQESDERLNFYIFKLETPMQPGEERAMQFHVAIENPGFRNSQNITSVVDNGTFFNNEEAMPFPGFYGGRMLEDRQARRRQGLAPVDRMPKLEDESQWTVNSLSPHIDFVTFRTTVSTINGQIAMAPGYLKKDWVEGDRHYFIYEMDAPIFNFYAWLSADYTVINDKWNDVDLQVLYHKPHAYNVDRMMKGMKDSLDYFTTNFGPYQHKQMRILEFPAYEEFAQSFPNTVPFSEGIGFMADNRDPKDIDYVYYVTAHEMAHQWWAHQVMGANVQGSAMLTETLSQYSALMVMKKEYGSDHMRRFLKYELDRYLSSRGAEVLEEQPLYRVENQPYLHYRKGSVIMYALQDYVGEEVVNRTLARLIELRAFKSAPYATTLDFLRLLREEAGPEYEEVISDFFKKIILFDLKVTDATAVKTDGNQWEVTLDLEAHKFQANGKGEQAEIPLDYQIDVGVFSKNLDEAIEGTGHVLYMQKHRVNKNTLQIKLVVDQEPKYAGVDPYNKLIDRISDDNLKRVTINNVS